jgi:hypothetical protein
MSSTDQLIATVRVEHVIGKESQPHVIDFLLVNTRCSAHNFVSHLGEYVST